MEKKIFDKVARADVGSEKLDLIKLQSQIAGNLNCHFESKDNVESRASQLKNSLMSGGKILIILDDVWSEIPINDIIGTSFGESISSKGCKILLTSTKLCLFLCSLFPEDAYISIRKLIQFAICSQLIHNAESTVRAIFYFLTISSLSLECDENHLTKLHEIIRDVARSMAFTDLKYAILHIRCGSQLPENAGNSTPKLLCLDVESNDARFPEDLVVQT
ncbi:disease resistance protein [Trifolium medium]|uniref:Disease resistance protein n=1 Tax=Trifolium medium TaxID=97028 RepID=A0A392MET9_9FABA|nr:disease resistance protein [Trifolium medium]